MRRMRNRMIHRYFDVNWDIVWDTVKNDFPPLKRQIEALLVGHRIARESPDGHDDGRIS